MGGPGSSVGGTPANAVDVPVTIDGFSPGPGNPTPQPAATCNPTVAAVSSVGITGVQTARVLANGALQPTTSFSSASDRKIVIVMTLDDHLVVTGTALSFVRIMGCKYTPSQTYTATRPLTHFEVAISASTQPFAPGHYRLLFYVNNKAGYDFAYDVS